MVGTQKQVVATLQNFVLPLSQRMTIESNHHQELGVAADHNQYFGHQDGQILGKDRLVN